MSKIREISFSNFRAYREQKFPIKLDKNIILLYGNNGFGKTSFFDGIEWGLTGKIERYNEAAKEKNEYPLLKNNLASNTQEGSVEVEFDNGFTINRKIKRTGQTDYNPGIQNITAEQLQINMVKEQFVDKIDFIESFNFSHLLSQELLSNFVRGTKDTDRYKAIVKLFGLSRYDKFNPHFKLMIEMAKKDLELVLNQISQIDKSIEIEKARATVIDIDPKIKQKELELYLHGLNYSCENVISELTSIATFYQQEKLKLENTLNTLNTDISELEYIDNNYDTLNKIILLIDLKKNELSSSKYNIDILNKYNELKYAEDNINIVSDVISNREKNEQKIIEYEEFDKLFTTNPFYSSDQIDIQIRHIAEIDSSFQTKVESFYELKKKNKALSDEINKLEQELASKFGLEKRLLKIAQEFLQENLQLNTCPVCQNTFDINKTIQKLDDRLMTEYSQIFLDLSKNIDRNKAENILVLEKIGKLESELKFSISELKEKKQLEKANLESETQLILSNRKLYESIHAKMALLNIPMDIVAIEEEFNKIFAQVKERNLNEGIEYYKNYKIELEKVITTNEDLVKTFLLYIKKHEISSKEDSVAKLKAKNDNLSLIKDIQTKVLNVIQISYELQQYNKTSEIKSSIFQKDSQRSNLIKEKFALERIINEYDNLLQNVRKTIEQDTKNALCTYIGCIRSFYSYLNPHIYLNNFDIKIDDSNAQNNRLVLEVFNEDSKKVNPSYIFSSAQNNVLALSIFLSFAVNKNWSNLDFICMDDPIQNLDDINIFNFIDIIRTLIRYTDKQIFISTHDDRVYNFMLKKFRGYVQSFEFIEYGRILEEAQISTEEPKDAEEPKKAKEPKE